MDYFSIFLAETIGTFLLILIGCGVNASVNLKKTYSNSSGWIVISFGWAIGVLVGASVASTISAGHINPAVTIAMWVEGYVTSLQALMYFLGEFLGAFLGALAVILLFWDHFKVTEGAPEKIGGTFYTSPAIKNKPRNLLVEIFATMVLVLSLLTVSNTAIYVPLFAGFVVLGIGLALGGLTGYSINPARDLMPRLAHTIVRIPNKGPSSDWGYAWVASIGPIVGSLFAVGLYELLMLTA